MTQVKAPWTAAQVRSLEKWQRGGYGYGHPYTCGNEHEGLTSVDLVPTVDGWTCPECDLYAGLGARAHDADVRRLQRGVRRDVRRCGERSRCAGVHRVVRHVPAWLRRRSGVDP